MVIDVSRFCNIYKFPMGRCEFSLREVERRADDIGVTQVATLAGRGAGEASDALLMIVRASGASRGQYSPKASAADNVVDHGVAAVDGYLEVQIRAYADEPRGLAAARIRKELFPRGVRAITGLPYAEQHSRVDILLEMAADPDLAADVASLPELSDLLARLRDRNRMYGVVLNAENSRPTTAQVTVARDKAQETLVQVFCLIVGLYALKPASAQAERDRLLEPILRQQEALRVLRRNRRNPTDVDPVTGDELPATEGDVQAADDAQAADDMTPETNLPISATANG